MSYLVSEDLGQGRRSRLAPLVDQAFGHLDQWFVTQNAPYMRPFMVALTSQALIQYYEKTGDSRVIPALTLAMDEIWNRNWDANAEAFRYTDRVVVDPSDTDPAPDLNLLIVPIYGFLYHETGQVRFMDRGDQIFAGGVRHAYLYNGKQFDQSYRWSFRYINWRTQAPKH